MVKPILIGINRVGGSDKNSFANNAVVSVKVENVTGTGLSISLPADNQIQLPGNWADLNNNTMSSELIEASLTLVASSTPGPYNGSITISGTGLNQEKTSAYVSRNLTLPVTATIVSCDTTPPTINVPTNITAEATSALGAAVPFTFSADDTNPLQPVVTCDHVSGSIFPLGTTTVTCSATDAAGNTGTNSFTITVHDTTGPVLDAVGNVTAEATGAAGTLVTYNTPGATDLVDGTITPVVCEPVSGSTFAIGSTPVTCSATDSHKNLGQTSFNIIVQDTTKPVLSLPVSVEKEATSSAGAEVTYTASASDVVDGAITPACEPASGSTFPLGSTPVGCSATDAHTNTATGSFTVNVVDTTAPALTLLDSFSVEATGPTGAAVTFVTSAVDLVDDAVSVTCSPASGSVFPLETTTVTCSAADTRGNRSEGSFNITVVDTTPPSLTVPADQKLEATGPSGAIATFTPSASDTVDTDPVVSCDYDSGHIFPLGTTTVSCTATDDAGNTAKGKFTIEVVDTTAPALSLPASFSKEATSSAGAVAVYTASAIDLVDGLVVPVCSPASGSTFSLGKNTVSCTATDKAGNAASGTFSVTVVDTTPPTLTLPANITEEATGPNGASVSFEASAFDLVDGTTEITCNPASGTTFSLGNTTVTCTSADSRGNASTKEFSITVQDTTPPALHLPDPITAEATSPAGAAVNFNATAIDLVDINDDVTCVPPSQSIFALGVTEVTCQATDKHNNTTSGSFKITVQDTTPPVISLASPEARTFLLNEKATVSFTCADVVSGVATCQGTQANGAALDTSSVGPHTFTVTSADNMGNTSTQSVTYTVTYATGGQCLGQPGHQVLQPINLDGSSVFKKGSTIPVKFRVCDANGNSVSTSGIVKSFTYSYSGTSTTDMVNEPVYSTTPDTNFRWSATDQQWIYNLSTKSTNFSITTNASRYIFTITLNDGSIIPFVIGLK